MGCCMLAMHAPAPACNCRVSCGRTNQEEDLDGDVDDQQTQGRQQEAHHGTRAECWTHAKTVRPSIIFSMQSLQCGSVTACSDFAFSIADGCDQTDSITTSHKDAVQRKRDAPVMNAGAMPLRASSAVRALA